MDDFRSLLEAHDDRADLEELKMSLLFFGVCILVGAGGVLGLLFGAPIAGIG